MKCEFVDEFLSMDLPWDKLKNASILVTGGNGLIASNLLELLAFANQKMSWNMEIYALCRNKERAEQRFAELSGCPFFHFIISDVSEPLKENVNFDYIFHAASSAHPQAFNNTPVDVMRANLIGTWNLLDYCKSSKTRFIFVSSSEIYGENYDMVEYFDETMNGSVDCTTFRSCYPESKRASETLCMCYKKQYGSDVIVVRPAFIYGRDVLDSNNRADAFFLKKVLHHEDIVMYSEGKQVRSYCHVNDCVSGMLYAALKGESGEVYNIGDENNAITLHDYAQTLADIGDVQLRYEPDTAPQNTVFLNRTRCVLKTDKLRRLGWSPKYSLETGIREMLCVDNKNSPEAVSASLLLSNGGDRPRVHARTRAAAQQPDHRDAQE